MRETRALSFFWFAIVACVAWSFTWTHRALLPHDTIAPRVPADVLEYVHLRSARAEVMLAGRAMFALPDELAPTEIAALRYVAHDTDGSTKDVAGAPLEDATEERRATVVAWRDARRMTDAERTALRAADAVALDARTFVLGEHALDAAALLAAPRASGASLNDGAVGNGLRLARSVAPMQRYVAEGDTALPFANVSGVVFAEDGRTAATLILPLDGLRPEQPLFGFGIHDGNARAKRQLGTTPRAATSSPALALRDAALVHRSREGAPAVPGALLEGVLAAARVHGTLTSGAPLASAASALADVLQPPFTLSVAAEGTATALHLPTVSPERLAETLNALMDALFPATRELTLPDGTTVREYVAGMADLENPALAPADPGLPWPAVLRPGHPAARATALPGATLAIDTDGFGGSLLTDVLPSGEHGTTLEALPSHPTEPPSICRTASTLAKESLRTEQPPSTLYRISETVFMACG